VTTNTTQMTKVQESENQLVDTLNPNLKGGTPLRGVGKRKMKKGGKHEKEKNQFRYARTNGPLKRDFNRWKSNENVGEAAQP